MKSLRLEILKVLKDFIEKDEEDKLKLKLQIIYLSFIILNINSLYFHMFDARFRLKTNENDFTVWFKEKGQENSFKLTV